jgi:hypothetical protein
VDPGPAGDGALAVGYRRSALTPLGVLAAIMALATAYTGFLALGGGFGPATAAFPVCALLTLFFVPLFLRAVVRALRGAPLLSLDGHGVTLHSARVTLPWSNVAEIRIDHRPGHADLLVFVPVEEDRAVGALRGLPRRFAADGIRRVGGPIFVRVPQLAAPIEDVLAAAHRLSTAPVRHSHHLARG